MREAGHNSSHSRGPGSRKLGLMERPTSIPGLVVYLARQRWQSLTPRGRMLAAVLGTTVALGGAWGAMHAAHGGACCHGGCPSHHAAAQADDGGDDGEQGGCPYHRH